VRLLSREENESAAKAARRRPAHRPSLRGPSPIGQIPVPLVAWIVAPVVLLGMLLGAFRLARHGTLPHLKVAGVPVGGLSGEELRRVVEQMAARRALEEVTVVRAAGLGGSRSTATAIRQDLGYRVDVPATVDEILHRGRQANPIAALADQVVSSFVGIDVRPIERIDTRVFDRWLSATVAALSISPREGDLRFDGATVTEVDPAPGIGISRDDLRARATDSLNGVGPVTITMPAEALSPRMSLAAVKKALASAQRALSAPARLNRSGRSLEFTPEEIGRVLEAEPIERNGQLVLQLVGDPDAMRKVAAKYVHEVEVPAVNARFVPSGDGVRIIPSKNGFGFDPKKAADALVRAATSLRREATMRGNVIRPDLTTLEARALHIDQMVSTFTTYHPCCQPRVTNIHRIADLLDGSVVKPGETFSVNAIVGERTPEKGFVIAPGISEGLIVDQLGGGISQFGTTIFNAVFFGGYQFVEFQHHSYYFTRYPAGRDATISWPGPDFAFKNDSKYGIYINTSYTDTSITVTFYGHKDYHVEAVTTGPYKFTDPPTQCKDNPSLAPGVTNVTQEGSQGFDILVKRVFDLANGTTRVEDFFTHYKPEPHLVEMKSCSAKASPSPPPSASSSP
jgi:vancomycin resistance protein YoaR